MYGSSNRGAAQPQFQTPYAQQHRVSNSSDNYVNGPESYRNAAPVMGTGDHRRGRGQNGYNGIGSTVYSVQDTSTQTKTQETEFGGVLTITTTTVTRTITERVVASDEDSSDDEDDDGENAEEEGEEGGGNDSPPRHCGRQRAYPDQQRQPLRLPPPPSSETAKGTRYAAPPPPLIAQQPHIQRQHLIGFNGNMGNAPAYNSGIAGGAENVNAYNGRQNGFRRPGPAAVANPPLPPVNVSPDYRTRAPPQLDRHALDAQHTRHNSLVNNSRGGSGSVNSSAALSGSKALSSGQLTSPQRFRWRQYPMYESTKRIAESSRTPSPRRAAEER